MTVALHGCLAEACRVEIALTCRGIDLVCFTKGMCT